MPGHTTSLEDECSIRYRIYPTKILFIGVKASSPSANHGHNTLVIDNKLQIADGKGQITGFSNDPEFPHTIVDLGEVYQGQAAKRMGLAQPGYAPRCV